MREAPERSADLEPELDAASRRCLERTRSVVLDVLVGVGLSVAASGLVLRFVDARPSAVDLQTRRTALYGGLVAVIVASHLTRRGAGSRARLRPPETRSSRFFRSRVGSAAVGSLATPLGLAYGLAVAPRLEDVVVFWTAALVLGVLSLPRAVELGGFPEPMASDDESAE